LTSVSGFRIGGFTIDKIDNHHCFVIAEAGSNHDQIKNNAFELIDTAAECGADAVKFQLFSSEKLYSKFTPRKILDQTKHAQLPKDWVPELMDRCKSQKIIFLATPFDYEAVSYLDELGIAAFKWASGEITDLGLLSFAAQKLKPIIIATGMCSLSDIELAIGSVTKKKNEKIALLHCISMYPSTPKDANLRMMETLDDAFDYPVGYSDHTLGLSIAIAAVARGAKILEKHFTLDKKLHSPDHNFALRPKELKNLVRSVREVSLSLGYRTKRMIKGEEQFSRICRRSLIAKKDIQKGSKISATMLTVKRPGTGIHPTLANIVVGRTATAAIEQDQILKWSMIS
jgi:N,N'-diacetyllegionaminate synthase